MMKVVIDNVTDTSLQFTVQAGDVIRQRKTLTKGDETSVTMSGKLYRYEEVRIIWEKYASSRDDRGSLVLPFAFNPGHESFQQQL